MAKMTPASHAMAILERWPHGRTSLATPEILELIARDHGTVYRWMMKLATYGYFSRSNQSPGRGGTLVVWTITAKGRATALELQGIPVC